MPRILFVDDESLILNSLRLRFGRRRPEWSCTFAADGLAALAHLDGAPFDVVVTDMRMPGLDGATLLGIVRERHPQTFRVVLSAQMSRDAQLRALPVTHRFHAKPCAPEALEQTIEQALELSACFRGDAIARLVGGLQSLPPAPEVYRELSRLMADPAVGIHQLATTVDRDPATAARLLHVSNSAFFGVRRRIGTSLEALNWLGVDLTRKLVLTAGVGASFGATASRRLIEDVQEHGLLTARIASRLVAPSRARSVSTAALLHDVGRLVLAEADRSVWAAVAGEVGERFGDTTGASSAGDRLCARVGAYLLNLWGLPLDIVNAVARHRDPVAGPTPEELSPSGAIHVASELARAARRLSPYVPDPRQLAFDPVCMQAVGAQLKLHEWCQMASHQHALMGHPSAPA